eukprot:UN3122
MKQSYVEGLSAADNPKRVFAFRFPRADDHSEAIYAVLDAIPPNKHIVVACSFWPEVSRLPSRHWRLWEWDDKNDLHELPSGTDVGGRVGKGNTNEDGQYVAFWNRSSGSTAAVTNAGERDEERAGSE